MESGEPAAAMEKTVAGKGRLRKLRLLEHKPGADMVGNVLLHLREWVRKRRQKEDPSASKGEIKAGRKGPIIDSKSGTQPFFVAVSEGLNNRS